MDGAITESLYVYIEQGLHFISKATNNETLNILEIGFGTGLNCYLTKLNQGNKIINYTALEPNILPNEIIESLNYTSLLSKEEQFFAFIHNSDSINRKVKYSNSFHFILNDSTFENFHTTAKFDLIYFDGFDLRKDSNIWSHYNIRKVYNLLNRNGIMITYASNRLLKETLHEANFEIQILPGAINKREMIRAIKY